nr:T9SS type A sorting domain-containing protein [uncultured Psychroserpens sp.]
MINRILFLVFILISFSVSAQLTVTNDSYIFVDGNGFTEGPDVAPLYVTNAVNLTNANSNIYLRNEAQLLQGNTVSTNSGLGELSVFQNGNTNQWAYNYWCSPVGNNSATSGNEAARVNLIDDSTGLISSNDAIFTNGLNGTSSPLQIASRWIYSYVTSDEYSEWIDLDETSNISPGLGFTMKGMGPSLMPGASSQLYDFRGKANSGTITNNVATNQFTLIGNPYPSALDAADFLWDPQNVNLDDASPFVASTTGALYFWEQAPNSNSHSIEDYVGGYASYTCSQPNATTDAVAIESFVPAPYNFHLGDGTVVIPPGATVNGSHVARRYIPIGQGFMVEGASNGLVYVKNSHRNFYKESSPNSEFFRTDTANSDNVNTATYDDNGFFQVPSGYKRFRVMGNFNDLYSRELLANFHDSATEGFDYGLEAKGSGAISSDMYWVLDDEEYVIQAHAFNVELRIPLVVNVDTQQAVKFGIFDIQNFDTSQEIYIYDSESEIYVNLRNQNYSINLEPGDYSNRFEITFQPGEALHIEELSDKDFVVFQNTKTAELTVLNPNGFDIKTMTLCDVTGKIAISSKNLGSQNAYRFSTKSLSEGIYVATVTVNNNQSISKKVIIKN